MKSGDPIIVRDSNGSEEKLVLRGTDVPFQTLLDYWAAGRPLDQFLADFPSVPRETAVAACEHARALLVGFLI